MGEHLLELQVAWQRHVTHGVDGDTSLLDRLMGRYREKHRRYHDVDHVTWVVRHVQELAADETVERVDAVIAAAFYHDAIYEPASPANERASARLARRDLAAVGWSDADVAVVGTMIEGTSTHIGPADVDTAVLFDADLAILGADPARYGEYVNDVRAEYRHVDDADWITGRRGVLNGFLERDSLFATASARNRWETRARANIASELASLAAT